MEITCDDVDLIASIINDMAATMTPYIATCGGLEPPPSQEFEYSDRKDMLKHCTRLVRLLELSIACYPLTVTSVIFFDENGDPIPD